MNGHQIAAEQIQKHGRDRYPTTGQQYAKVLEEIGELGAVLIAMSGSVRDLARHIHDDDGTVEGCPGCFVSRETEQVCREYGDAGLALFELGNKMGLDLIACMRAVVRADERKF